MRNVVTKKLIKEFERLPLFAQELAKKEIENINKAKNFNELIELSDVVPMEGTDDHITG